MKNLLLSIMLCISILLVPIKSHSQVEGFAGGIAVSSVIDNLLLGISDIIEQLEVSASLLVFQTRSDLLFTAENLKRMALELEGKIFEDLTKQQQMLFNNLNQSINLAKEGAIESIEKVNNIVRMAGTEASRVIGIDDKPFVYSINPGYVLYEDEGETIFKLKGSSLGNGDMTLKYGNQSCQILSRTELDVSFKCINANLGEQNKWLTGSFEILIDEPWWKLFSKDKQYNYPVSLKRIPKQIGIMELKVTTKEVIETRENRSEERVARAGPCRSNGAAFNFSPQQGCLIDVQTVNAVPGPVSSRSSYEGIRNLTETGFQTVGTARGSGRRVLGSCTGGGNGVVISRATWTDVCKREENQTSDFLTTENNILDWQKDLSFNLPEDTIGFTLIVHQVNGKVVSVGSYNQSTEWFDVQFDELSKSLLIKPKNISEVRFD